MTSPRGAARAPLAALALLGALAMAGCGDDADAPPGATSTPTSSAEPTDATGATEDPTDDPTDGATPTESAATPSVAPAAGPAMELDGMTLNVPEGWEISITGDQSQGAFNAGGGPGAMSVTLLGAVPGEDLESDAQSALETAQSDRLKPERLEDRTIGGVEAWVITGGKRNVPLSYSVGGVAGGDTFLIGFEFLTKPPTDVQATIDAVLASVTFDAV